MINTISMQLPVDDRLVKDNAIAFYSAIVAVITDNIPSDKRKESGKSILDRIKYELSKANDQNIDRAEFDCGIDVNGYQGMGKNYLSIATVRRELKSGDIKLNPADVLFKTEIYDKKKNLSSAFQGRLDVQGKKLYITVSFQKETMVSAPFEFTALLAKKHLLGKNAGFRISAFPIQIRYDDLKNLDDLASKKILPVMPIILTSNELVLQSAEFYSGAATILLADDLDMLQEIAGEKKPIPKTDRDTYIFFPSGAVKVLQPEEGSDADDTLAIAAEIMDCLLNNQTVSFTDNQQQYDLSYSCLIEGFRQKNNILQANINDLAKQLDAEKKKSSLIYDAAKKAEKLVKGTSVSTPAESIGLKKGGKEYYGNEIKMVILDSLKEYRKNSVLAGTRRADILDEVIKANDVPDKENPLYIRREEIKDILSDYGGANPKTMSDLEKLGFKMRGGNKHINGKWHGDDKYRITIPSSPSDARGNKNLISEIINNLF